MAPPAKATEGRRKSSGKPTLIITLTLPSKLLRDAMGDKTVEAESPAAASDHKDTSGVKESPSTPAPAAPPSNGEPASDSNAATPAADVTPAPSVMGPPTDSKKKGVKRSAVDNHLKIRGKPGPKKKPRLEDGTIDHAAVRAYASKLGPKANQGAINAGLRALDRSGKPCRKWAKGSFVLKSFTGVVWGINRWTAPPKTNGTEGGDSEVSPPADSVDSSNKENKDTDRQENGNASTSNSNAGGDIGGHTNGDVEMHSIPSVNASSPAPVAVAAVS